MNMDYCALMVIGLAFIAGGVRGRGQEVVPPQPHLVVLWRVDEDTQTTAQPSTGPTTEDATEPTTDSTTEPTTEATTEPTTDSTTEPTTDSTTEPTTEATTEPTTDSTTEPTTDYTTEPTTTLNVLRVEAVADTFIVPAARALYRPRRNTLDATRHDTARHDTHDTTLHDRAHNTRKLLAVINGTRYTAICTGALVDKRFVLTSATCTDSLPSADKIVITTAEVTNLTTVKEDDDEYIFYKVEQVIPYGNTAINNLALLKLEEDIKDYISNPKVKFVEWRTSVAPVGTPCTSSYWGINGTQEQVVESRAVIGCPMQTWEHVCAQTDPPSMGGSSLLREGATLVCEGKVAGIFSASLDGSTILHPMRYQEVSLYDKWLTKNIKNSASTVVTSLTAVFIMAVLVAATAF